MLDNFYWAMYRKLENEILELTYYIQFTDFGESNNCQKNVFSHKIADLLISICIQIETLFKILYKKELTDTKQHSINQKIKFLDEKYKLSKKKIKIISSEMYFSKGDFSDFFSPMSYKSKSENDYYSNYCAIKHYRNINNLHKANVNVLIRALGALYILNVYNKFQDDETDSFLNYDYTLGSKIFQVSGDIKPSQGDILKFIKNKNYENFKINFIENIPENDEELVMYANNNSFPSLFLVKINI